MEKLEKEIATAMRKAVAKREPMLKVRGTLKDYYIVYRDHERGDGDYSRSIATDLYKEHGFEYCVLLEVLPRFPKKETCLTD